MVDAPIWMYWHQGWDHAPELVQRCAVSWQRHNPGREVVLLDGTSLERHVPFPAGIDPHRPDLTVQKIAALTRLALLAKHGGVWADATTFCVQPLDEWLDDHRTSDGFFAFRNPGPDRLMSNWFIAADADSVILKRLADAFTAYYRDNRFTNQTSRFGRWILRRYEPRWAADAASTLKWQSWFVRKVLRVYPYFAFHYVFNRLALNDLEVRRLWSTGKPLSADPAHRLQHFALLPAGGIEAALAHIDARQTPVHKLDWRHDPSQPYWARVLNALEAAR